MSNDDWALDEARQMARAALRGKWGLFGGSSRRRTLGVKAVERVKAFGAKQLEGSHMFLLTLLVVAQVSSPQASATASPVQPLTVSWPAHIDISAASTANFERFNHGSGSMLVQVKCDGSKTPMIPPTRDIDGDLRSALMTFVSDAKVAAGASCHDQIFVVQFEVPSGNMTETQLPAPAR